MRYDELRLVWTKSDHHTCVSHAAGRDQICQPTQYPWVAAGVNSGTIKIFGPCI
jgi:hypothetical protein